MPGYIGNPPYCKPECTSNSECAPNFACINQKCKDPCINACGVNAQCKTISHSPMCFCAPGYTGDAFTSCSIVMHTYAQEVTHPCQPSPCGPNAVCKELNRAGSCTCLTDYIGNPYEGCRPECTVNTDCSPNKACIRNKCLDPCPGSCSPHATCVVVSHLPTCTCPVGYTGDPFRQCVYQEGMFYFYFPTTAHYYILTMYLKKYFITVQNEPPTPCTPNPCGPNSECRAVNGQSVCSCMIGYNGIPPGCRPECTVSSECATNKACVNQKCVNPCPNHCGIQANCRVINHSPICSCNPGFTGDPFMRCFIQRTYT